MTLEDLGNIGEFVGAIGVVASLIYLALQTRQNTRAVRVASFHQISESVSALSLAVFQDADLVSLMERVRSEPETLTSEDATRYGFFLLTLFRRAESMFFHSELGALERESWAGIHVTLENSLRNASAQKWWSESEYRFNPVFRAYVETELLQNEEPVA